MCGGGRDKARREAEKKQREAEELARERQEELNRLAAQRKLIVDGQREREKALKAQSDLIAANQATRIKELQVDQDARLKEIRTAAQADRDRIEGNARDRANSITGAAAQQAAVIKAAADKKAGRIERAGNAATNSLRVLGQKQPTAPTAQQTRRGARRAGARATAPSVERGSARNSRGTNLSI